MSGEGNLRLQQMLENGFSDAEVLGYQQQRTAQMQQNGFTDSEIGDYYGVKPENQKPLEDHFSEEMHAADLDGQRNVPMLTGEGIAGLNQLFYKALVDSPIGHWMTAEDPQAESFRYAEVSTGSGWAGRFASGLGHVYSDLPLYIAGGHLAGPAAGARQRLGTAMALTEGARSILTKMYEEGPITTAKEFWDRSVAASWSAAKGYVVGQVTGATGAVTEHMTASALARYAAEIPAMIATGAALEGRIPDKQEFVDGALLMGALHLVGKMGPLTERVQMPKMLAKLFRVYDRTGIRPEDVLRDSMGDPSIVEDLFSDIRDIPRAYDVPEYMRSEEARAEWVTRRDKAATKAVKVRELARRPGTPGEGAAAENLLKIAYERYQLSDEDIDNVQQGKPLPEAPPPLTERERKWNAAIGAARAAGLEKKTYWVVKRKAADGTIETESPFGDYIEADKFARSIGGTTEPRFHETGEKWMSQGMVDEIQRTGGLTTPGGKGPTPPTGTPPPGAAGPTPTPEEDLASILSKVAVGQRSEHARYAWKDFYRDVFDTHDPTYRAVKSLWDATNAARGGKPMDLDALADTYKLLRESPALLQRASAFFKLSTFRYKDLEKNGESMEQIFRDADKAKVTPDELRGYMLANRGTELENRGIRTPFDREEMSRTVANLGPRVQIFADRMVAYNDRLLQYLRDSGIVSRDSYSMMKAANRHFVPFHKLFAGETGEAGPHGGKRPRNPIHAIFGNTELMQLDPLEGMLKNTYAFIRLAEQNRIARSFVDLAIKSPIGDQYAKLVKKELRPTRLSEEEKQKLIDKVFGKDAYAKLSPTELSALEEEFTIFRQVVAPLREGHIQLYRNGVREIWEVDRDVWHSIQGLNSQDLGLWTKFMAEAAAIQRSGYVLTPQFALRNPARDTLTRMIYVGVHPIAMMKGVFETFHKGELWEEWQRSGGPMSSIMSVTRDLEQQDLQDMLRDKSLWRRTRNVALEVVTDPRETTHRVMESPKAALETLRLMSEYMENMTRLGVSIDARSQGASIAEAGFRSREGTLDFNRIGRRMHDFAMIRNFLNPHFQGWDKLVREAKNHPYSLMGALAALIVAPTIDNWVRNRDREDVGGIPAWQKRMFWLYPTSNKDFDGHIIPVPVPPEFLPLKILVEESLERIFDHDRHAFDDFLEGVSQSFAFSVIPTPLVGAIQTMSNYDLFLDRPRVSPELARLLPEAQFQPYTTELAKKMGRMIAQLPGMKHSNLASPIMLEGLVRDEFGGLGVELLRFANVSLTEQGLLPERADPEADWADFPIWRTFGLRSPTIGSEDASRFQEMYHQREQQNLTLQALRKWGLEGDTEASLVWSEMSRDPKSGRQIQPEGVKHYISNMMSAVRAISRNQRISDPAQKRQLLDGLMIHIDRAARAGIEFYDRVDDHYAALKELRGAHDQMDAANQHYREALEKAHPGTPATRPAQSAAPPTMQ